MDLNIVLQNIEFCIDNQKYDGITVLIFNKAVDRGIGIVSFVLLVIMRIVIMKYEKNIYKAFPKEVNVK